MRGRHARAGAARLYAQYGRGLAACGDDPARRLAYEVRCILNRTHPCLHRQTADELVEAACDQARKAGLSDDLITDIIRNPDLHQWGASTLRKVIETPLATRSDGWISVYAAMAPRILLCAAPQLGQTAYGRTYTEAELGELSHWCLTIQCVEWHAWYRFAVWCGALYREYTRRAKANGWPVRQHACEDRVAWLRLATDEETFHSTTAANAA